MRYFLIYCVQTPRQACSETLNDILYVYYTTLIESFLMKESRTSFISNAFKGLRMVIGIVLGIGLVDVVEVHRPPRTIPLAPPLILFAPIQCSHLLIRLDTTSHILVWLKCLPIHPRQLIDCNPPYCPLHTRLPPHHKQCQLGVTWIYPVY
ncbi:hypothetical protein BDQ17DRAFT_953519 [Cyathus striatus]|nr:hypothetical protein BDQ17DRAFT_953519 [Cyathus striatus]